MGALPCLLPAQQNVGRGMYSFAEFFTSQDPAGCVLGALSLTPLSKSTPPSL